MDSNFYQAIISTEDDDHDQQRAVISSYTGRLCHETTDFMKNTALHVAVLFQKEACVEEICKRCSPSLLLQQNMNGDTPLHIAARLRPQENMTGDSPLHIAARLGPYNIANILIKHAQNFYHHDEIAVRHDHFFPERRLTVLQQLVRMPNNRNDTALHEAVRSHSYHVANLLTYIDPDFEYFANLADETPLYLAVEEGMHDIVKQILNKCPTSAHTGPRGRTALHAALLVNSETSDITKLLLEKKPSTIVNEVDETGSSALHYAAYFGRVEDAAMILKADRRVGYLRDKNGMTALHIAARSHHMPVSEGYENGKRITFNVLATMTNYKNIFGRFVEIIEKVSEYCPECWEIVDNNGETFVHAAARNGMSEVIEYVLEKSAIQMDKKKLKNEDNNRAPPLKMAKNLINEKDKDGNTPLHLVVKSASLEKSRSRLECLRILCRNDTVNKKAVNNQNLTALDMVLNDMEKADDAYEDFFWIAHRYLYKGDFKWKGRRLIKEEEEKYKAIVVDYSRPKISTNINSNSNSNSNCKKDSVSQNNLLIATLITTVTFAAGLTVPGAFNENDPDKGMAVLIKKDSFVVFVVFNSLAMMASLSVIFAHFTSAVVSHKFPVLRSITSRTDLFMTTAIIYLMIAFVTGSYSVLNNKHRLAVGLCTYSLAVFVSFFIMILSKTLIIEILEGFRKNCTQWLKKQGKIVTEHGDKDGFVKSLYVNLGRIIMA